MRNEPWVWPKVGDAGTSGAGAVPARSAQMEQQKKTPKNISNDCYLFGCSGQEFPAHLRQLLLGIAHNLKRTQACHAQL